jgi:hypothetical protein
MPSPTSDVHAGRSATAAGPIVALDGPASSGKSSVGAATDSQRDAGRDGDGVAGCPGQQDEAQRHHEARHEQDRPRQMGAHHAGQRHRGDKAGDGHRKEDQAHICGGPVELLAEQSRQERLEGEAADHVAHEPEPERA